MNHRAVLLVFALITTIGVTFASHKVTTRPVRFENTVDTWTMYPFRVRASIMSRKRHLLHRAITAATLTILERLSPSFFHAPHSRTRLQTFDECSRCEESSRNVSTTRQRTTALTKIAPQASGHPITPPRSSRKTFESRTGRIAAFDVRTVNKVVPSKSARSLSTASCP